MFLFTILKIHFILYIGFGALFSVCDHFAFDTRHISIYQCRIIDYSDTVDMKEKYSTLHELTNTSAVHKVKIKVIEKSRAFQSRGKKKYQRLLLQDEKVYTQNNNNFFVQSTLHFLANCYLILTIIRVML